MALCPSAVFNKGSPYYDEAPLFAGQGFNVCEAAFEYCPRHPEETVLYQVVAENIESFLARQQERGRVVPRFVERELRAFLECGILANGFVRVHCDICRKDLAVPYSCKHRGFCPSCGGRRMADTAAHLVDHVFPEVPVRQWVLSVPFELRYRLAYDSSLVSDVLQIFVRTVFASIRRRAGIPASNRKARCGAVGFIQRFSDALNLDPHAHLMALDGLYIDDSKGNPVFQRVGPPTDAEVARVAERVHQRVLRLMQQRGLGPQADPEEADALRRDEPLLAEFYSASISGRVATGPRAGKRIARVGDGPDSKNAVKKPEHCCALVEGFSVHGGVCVPARDRIRLERLLRYAARPPLSNERLSLLPNGRLLYKLKRRWSDGTTKVIYEPMELMERLAALVPPPRFNITRFYGVLAPASTIRPLIVPQDTTSIAPTHLGCPAKVETPKTDSTKTNGKRGIQPKNYSWAQLMMRVFEVDVLSCPRCGGRMRVLCAINSQPAIQKILACLKLPMRAPPIAPAISDEDEFYQYQ
jgi:hypothetical protein